MGLLAHYGSVPHLSAAIEPQSPLQWLYLGHNQLIAWSSLEPSYQWCPRIILSSLPCISHIVSPEEEQTYGTFTRWCMQLSRPATKLTAKPGQCLIITK